MNPNTGASEFAFVMNLEQRVQSGGARGAEKRLDFVVGQRPDDEEDRAGAGLARLTHLDRVHHEILAQARPGRRCDAEMRSDLAQIVECAAEEFFVREHGERIGAGVLVAAGLFEGGRTGLDVAGGGRTAFDFGNDRECAVGAPEGVRKRRRAGKDGVELRQFRLGHRPDERSDFVPFPRHDLDEFVGHRKTRNTSARKKTRPNERNERRGRS